MDQTIYNPGFVWTLQKPSGLIQWLDLMLCIRFTSTGSKIFRIKPIFHSPVLWSMRWLTYMLGSLHVPLSWTSLGVCDGIQWSNHTQVLKSDPIVCLKPFFKSSLAASMLFHPYEGEFELLISRGFVCLKYLPLRTDILGFKWILASQSISF